MNAINEDVDQENFGEKEWEKEVRRVSVIAENIAQLQTFEKIPSKPKTGE